MRDMQHTAQDTFETYTRRMLYTNAFRSWNVVLPTCDVGAFLADRAVGTYSAIASDVIPCEHDYKCNDKNKCRLHDGRHPFPRKPTQEEHDAFNAGYDLGFDKGQRMSK